MSVTCASHASPKTMQIAIRHFSVTRKAKEHVFILNLCMFCRSVLQFANLAFVSHKVVETSLQCTFVVNPKVVACLDLHNQERLADINVIFLIFYVFFRGAAVNIYT